MTISRKAKAIALGVGLVAASILMLIGGSRVLGLTSPAQTAFGRNYSTLKLGMTKTEVQSLLGEVPTYACRFSTSEIWYYARPGPLTGRFPPGTPSRGTVFQNSAELPDIYANVQLAFDSRNQLIAFTLIGESYNIETRGGPVKGCHFKCLPPGTL